MVGLGASGLVSDRCRVTCIIGMIVYKEAGKMKFDAESILLSLFTGVVAGISAYIAAYMKSKGELKAATEGLARFIENQVKLTRALEYEKLEIATQGAIASETRKCVYSLVVACQGLLHSMCWVAWNVKAQSQVRSDLLKSYDEEAHKLLPEIAAQQTVLAHLDHTLYISSQECINEICSLDVAFGDAAILAERDSAAAVLQFKQLYLEQDRLSNQLSTTFKKRGVATA